MLVFGLGDIITTFTPEVVIWMRKEPLRNILFDFCWSWIICLYVMYYNGLVYLMLVEKHDFTGTLLTYNEILAIISPSTWSRTFQTKRYIKKKRIIVKIEFWVFDIFCQTENFDSMLLSFFVSAHNIRQLQFRIGRDSKQIENVYQLMWWLSMFVTKFFALSNLKPNLSHTIFIKIGFPSFITARIVFFSMWSALQLTKTSQSTVHTPFL